MSTVFYGFRVSKKDLWTFADEIKALSRTFCANLTPEDILHQLEVDKLTLECQIQLFDKGDDWIVRILENSHSLRDHFWKEGKWQYVFYDDRSDIPSEYAENQAEYEKLKELAEWAGDQIDARRYFLVPILDIWDLILEKRIARNKHA